MLKKLLLASILGLSCAASHAMQSPLSQHTLSDTVYNSEENEYRINAYSPNGFNTGYIEYKPILNHSKWWAITELWVHTDFRKEGLGTQLLAKSISHIKDKKAQRLTMMVNPFDSSLDRKATADIYTKMFAKIDKSLIPNPELEGKTIQITVDF